ncbi:MAG: hypothetical protein RJB40_293 [Actinomycetota bacterium]
MVLLYALYFSVRTVGVHNGLGTSAYDFGLYDQGIWLMSRGHSPFVTLMGRNLFGDHSSFILVLLIPLYWVFSSTALLFVVQSIVVAIGALPVYWFSRQRLRSEPLAAAMAGVYLLHPSISWTNLENFHPDAALGTLVAFAIWAAYAGKWRWYWVAVVLALSVKEDVAFVLAPLGLWVALKADKKRGLITSLASLFTMALMFLVVMRSFTGVAFRNSWRIPFGGIGGLLKTALTQPTKLISYLWSEDRPTYIWQMLAPVGFVFLYEPSLALVGFVMLASNVVSTFWYQHQIQYHYSIIIVPCIVMGTVWALGKFSRPARKWVSACIIATSLVCGYLWSPMPLARTTTTSWNSQMPPVVAARESISRVPEDAVVAAYHSLTAQMARRVTIYSFPNPFVRNLYGPDVFAGGDRLPGSDEVEYVILPVNLDDEAQKIWDVEKDQFRVVDENAWWVVYQRN